jgi:hypothetical protein
VDLSVRKRAQLAVTLAVCFAAQSSGAVLYLRLSRPVVEQKIQPPPEGENWSVALRKLYTKAGIPSYQIAEQAVPGSSQAMMICTVAGRGDSILVVSANLTRPKDDDAAAVAWASLAMLPLLAESLNAVSTESTVLLIAFPGDNHHRSDSSWYIKHLNESQRKQIKAEIEIAGLGRGDTTFDVKRHDHNLAGWLAAAALALRLPSPFPAEERDSIKFADAKAFRSGDIPAITVSSQPQHVNPSFSAAQVPVNKLYLDSYYGTYELLCVFLLELDRAARGAASESTVTPATPMQASSNGPVFTEASAGRMIVGQINDARTNHGVSTLRPGEMPELHAMVCDMAAKNLLETGPFEKLLTEKHLSGQVAVVRGSYPNLTQEQLQGLKVGRFRKLSVATCIVPSPDQKAPTYWIAVLVYE